MENYSEYNCGEFVETLASKSPVPGGGGASALVAAIGTALGNMVGSLTVGKAKYADVQDDIIELNAKAELIEKELLALIDADAVVFEPLSKAYGLPKDTPEELVHKQEVMERCLRECCDVPLNIMRTTAKAIDLHAEFAAKGTAIAISDVGCGVAICKAALLAASLNVFINTKSMQDRAYANDINDEANDLISKYTVRADSIYNDVAARLR